MTAAKSGARADSIGRFIAGDPLRAMAAVVVVLFHSLVVIASRRGEGFEAAYGEFGSQLLINSSAVIFVFFAGSGYLLGRPFVRAFVLGRPMPRIGNYARNRIARIVPVCWVALTVTFLVRGVGDSSIGEVAAVYALIQNLVPSDARDLVIHVWSVDAEMVFYVVLPIATFAIMWLFRGRGDQRSRLVFILALIGVAIAFSLLWRARHPLDLWWQRHMPGVFFAIGVGIALGALEIPGVAWARTLRRPALLGDGAFIAGWAILFGLTGFGDPGSLERGLPATAACTLIMGGLLVRQWAGAGAARWVDNRPLQAVGRWSYSIYLFHLVVMHLLVTNLETGSAWTTVAIVVPLTLAGAIAVGALSFQLIEKPCMRFRGISTQPTAAPHKEPTNLASGEDARGERLPGVPEPAPNLSRVDPPTPV